MGIFSRFMDIVNANINAILDKAEDPEKMLRLMVQEMEDTLIELKSKCSSLMSEGISKEKKVEELKKTCERWQSRAILALNKKREDLAREALVEKKNTEAEIERLKASLIENVKAVEETKEEIETLEKKLKETNEKLKLLKERKERAEAEKKTQEARSGRTKEYFDAMEEKIERMAGWNDLRKDGKSTDDKFKEFETDSEIEKELEELKKQMRS